MIQLYVITHESFIDDGAPWKPFTSLESVREAVADTAELIRVESGVILQYHHAKTMPRELGFVASVTSTDMGVSIPTETVRGRHSVFQFLIKSYLEDKVKLAWESAGHEVGV